ncbi:unnamed protein product [Rotaria sp. Silwood1]|nr:unnamed protein product [Rotaria sp. Silwood1]
MVTQYNPTIISLNELGTHVPDKTIKQLLFSYNIFTNKGTNPHGGVVLAIDKKLNSIQIKIDQLNIVAVQLIIKNQTYAIVSTYSPPNEPLPLQIMLSLTKNFKNIIIVGDLNAKHPNWGCTSFNHKGKILAEWLDINEMYEIQNQGMKTSLRSDTTIDLVLTTPTISLSQCTTLPYTVNYFKDRTITIDYQGHLSKQVDVSRGAPQGSCFGPKAYIVNHFDLPTIFDCSCEVHLYVDDLAIFYSPSIYLKYSQQTASNYKVYSICKLQL